MNSEQQYAHENKQQLQGAGVDDVWPKQAGLASSDPLLLPADFRTTLT
jgi:hypothetical protein